MTLQARLRVAAASVLRVRPESIDPRAPLARYGLDSLNAVELAVALGEIAGREFPDELLVSYPSLNAIHGYFADGDEGASAVESILVDSALPDDIQPAGKRDERGAILVTGASGFLGRHLVHALLAQESREIVCLVRASDDGAAQARLGLPVLAIAADLDKPRLGLSSGRYDELQARTATIFHCAAQVDWALGYEPLRQSNVLATLDLLRFASVGAKDFHYVSSTSSCLSLTNPRRVAEHDEPADPRGIPLGYAQTKWVSEALVREAGARGLPTAIYRPGLITGDSATGTGNNDDFLARFIKGCIELGATPDTTWRVDACPVDFVAAAIARLSRAQRPMSHLVNPHRASWLEAALWMNLRGHRLRVMPFGEWSERAAEASRDPSHALHPLRSFLLHRPAGGGGRTLPELYAGDDLGSVDGVATQEPLAHCGLECPRLGPALLAKWFDGFHRTGHLPVPSKPPRAAAPISVRPALERVLGFVAESVESFQLPGEGSILGELASWHAGTRLALRGYRVRSGAHTLEIVLKPKLEDASSFEVAAALADLCDARLGTELAAHWHRTSFSGTAEREIAAYRHIPRALAPRCHGVVEVDGQRALVLDYVRDLRLHGTGATWGGEHIEAALAGVAHVHALPVEDASAWMGPVLDARATDESMRLWLALADHARPSFAAWAGEAAARRLMRAAQRAPERARQLEALPRSLIHHDFNPRNVGLRGSRGRWTLCALDWELATLGAPQRDVAELLCFVLPTDGAGVDAAHVYIEHHRRRFTTLSGRRCPPPAWHDGFRLALEDFAVQRLTMYVVAHRVRPQPFLQRVVRTWAALSESIERSPHHVAA